jgi:hypothetical protein
MRYATGETAAGRWDDGTLREAAPAVVEPAADDPATDAPAADAPAAGASGTGN